MSEEDHKKENLTEREQSVLRHVVHNYIQTAIPVGSRYLSRHFESSVSPATIRNVMSDLEEQGFLTHPHTSAGRVPTDLGYRYYVDFLMEVQQLSEEAKSQIRQELGVAIDPADLFRESSRLLGKISNQLSVVSSPHVSGGVFDKLELIPIAASKLLVVISIRSGLVRTIMLEVGSEFRRDMLEQVSRSLNERLSGLTLQQIRDTFADRVREFQDDKSGLIRLFIDSVDELFDDGNERERIHIGGTKNIIGQPEFFDPRNFRSVIEMIESEEIIVHLLQKHDEAAKDIVITIGNENKEANASDYSMVTTTYNIEGISGRVGVIGPKRMDYPKLIPLVDQVAKTVAQLLAS
ncbi:MAG TPA: heat-inducible transcriptional repressor HrcA [Bacteroidota bacterium]|nr:heat-inducible transcriptional repressor HrcA [Bacteroidota bacterium]